MTRLHQTTTYENYRGMFSIKQLVKLDEQSNWATCDTRVSQIVVRLKG